MRAMQPQAEVGSAPVAASVLRTSRPTSAPQVRVPVQLEFAQGSRYAKGCSADASRRGRRPGRWCRTGNGSRHRIRRGIHPPQFLDRASNVRRLHLRRSRRRHRHDHRPTLLKGYGKRRRFHNHPVGFESQMDPCTGSESRRFSDRLRNDQPAGRIYGSYHGKKNTTNDGTSASSPSGASYPWKAGPAEGRSSDAFLPSARAVRSRFAALPGRDAGQRPALRRVRASLRFPAGCSRRPALRRDAATRSARRRCTSGRGGRSRPRRRPR